MTLLTSSGWRWCASPPGWTSVLTKSTIFNVDPANVRCGDRCMIGESVPVAVFFHGVGDSSDNSGVFLVGSCQVTRDCNKCLNRSCPSLRTPGK